MNGYNPTVSVIVPIYRVEDYLEDCIDSICRQSYDNLDIILVDDGSPDRCPVICDKYALADKRIRVIHKTNGGLSDARNAGLKVAKGEYAMFIDSDDYWLTDNVVSSLIDCLKSNPSADIVFFGRTTFVNGLVFPSKKVPAEDINGKDKISALEAMMRNGDFMASACQKLIRLDLIIDNNIFFTKNLLSEDWQWCISLYSQSKVLAAIDSNCYGYRQREGSITTSVSEKHLTDIASIIGYWVEQLGNMDISEREKNVYKAFLAYIYCILLAHIPSSQKTVRVKLYKAAKSFKHLLRYDISHKVKFVRALETCFGLSITMRILNYFISHRSKTFKHK